MFFKFENLGHRTELQRLGVLLAHETEILAVDLTLRMVEKEVTEAALYIVKQEMAHHVANFRLLDNMLTIAQEAANEISNEKTHQKALEWLQRVWDVLRKAAEESEAALSMVEAFNLMKQAKRQQVFFSANARQYLNEIEVTMLNLKREVAQQAPNIMQKTEAIRLIIEEKSSRY